MCSMITATYIETQPPSCLWGKQKENPLPPKKPKNEHKNTSDKDVNLFPYPNSPLISMTYLKKNS